MSVVFNDIKFKEFINLNLGGGAVTILAKGIGKERQNVDKWINGRSKKGPSGDSWKLIIDYFKKRGITVKQSDFYIRESDYGEKSNELPATGFGNNLREPLLGYKKRGADDRLDALVKAVAETTAQLNNLLSQLAEEMRKRK